MLRDVPKGQYLMPWERDRACCVYKCHNIGWHSNLSFSKGIIFGSGNTKRAILEPSSFTYSQLTCNNFHMEAAAYRCKPDKSQLWH